MATALQPSDGKRQDRQLTDKQLAVLQATADLGFDASLTEIANQAGVARQTLSKWIHHDADFQGEWDEMPRRILRARLPSVVQVLVNKALKGEQWAIDRVLEITRVTKTQDQEQAGSVTSLHLQIIQRASNWEDYLAIKKNVEERQNIIEARVNAPSDDGETE